MEIALSSQDLVKTYGSGAKAVHALQGVTLSVAGGEIFSLLGPNGAGKTTLIKCVLGIVFTTSGTGSVLGSPFGSVSAKEHIGYLPENHRYPPHLTGGQVLRYFGKLSGLDGPKIEQQISRTLELTGMSDWRDTKVRKYSKGMMQRLGLAQALINDPQLIMLDEPTDGVDPVGRKEIREVLVRLKGEGKTIFLNSHLLSEVELISDRVAIMDHGKIVKEGRVDDLLRTEHVYQVQVQNLQPAMLSSLGASVLSVDGNSIEIRCATPNDFNLALDHLRGQGAIIESMTPKKSSLEDLFVDLIKSSDITHQ
jgi:ABC-2 type transport system ATP-binding protein